MLLEERTLRSRKPGAAVLVLPGWVPPQWNYCGVCGVGCPVPSKCSPDGELYAITIVVARLEWHAEVCFIIGCLPVYNGLQEHKLHGANEDLWQHLWALVDKKELTLIARWVKPHLDR